METRLKDYLSRDYPEAGITSVQVGGDQVAVQGYCPAGQTYALAEIPPYQDVTESSEFPFAIPVSSGTFSATLDRWVERDGMLYDRALSKWAVVLLEGEKETLASHARYADQVGALPELPPLELSSKKGLGGFHINPVVGDLDELGITSVTVNILPTQQMFLSPRPTPWRTGTGERLTISRRVSYRKPTNVWPFSRKRTSSWQPSYSSPRLRLIRIRRSAR